MWICCVKWSDIAVEGSCSRMLAQESPIAEQLDIVFNFVYLFQSSHLQRVFWGREIMNKFIWIIEISILTNNNSDYDFFHPTQTYWQGTKERPVIAAWIISTHPLSVVSSNWPTEMGGGRLITAGQQFATEQSRPGFGLSICLHSAAVEQFTQRIEEDNSVTRRTKPHVNHSPERPSPWASPQPTGRTVTRLRHESTPYERNTKEKMTPTHAYTLMF